MEKKPYIINNKGGYISPYVGMTDLTQLSSPAISAYWEGRIIPDNPEWVFSPRSPSLISQTRINDILHGIGPEEDLSGIKFQKDIPSLINISKQPLPITLPKLPKRLKESDLFPDIFATDIDYINIQPLLDYYNNNIRIIERFYKDIIKFGEDIINTLNQLPANCGINRDPININFDEFKLSPLSLENTNIPYPKYKKEITELYNVIDNSITNSYNIVDFIINDLTTIKFDTYKC